MFRWEGEVVWEDCMDRIMNKESFFDPYVD